MDESILDSVKKLLGIDSEETAFDTDIRIHINSVLMNLSQLGVCEAGVVIASSEETWSSVYSNPDLLPQIKDYVFLKVKLLFDPPNSNIVVECMKQQISEIEERIIIRLECEFAEPEEEETITENDVWGD